MKTIKFTESEIRALRELICNHNACRSGCVYDEMQDSKKGCNECEFTKSVYNIMEKLNSL